MTRLRAFALALAAFACLLSLCVAVALDSERMDERERGIRSSEFESLVGSAQSELQFDQSALAELDTDLQLEAELEAGVEGMAAQAARNRAKFEAQMAKHAAALAASRQEPPMGAEAAGFDVAAMAAGGDADALAALDPSTEKADADADALEAAAAEGAATSSNSTAAAAGAAPAAVGAPAGGEKPNLPWDDVRLRLRKHRSAILGAEAAIAQQTKEMRAHLKEFPVPQLRGEMSSGENYWNRGIADMKRSDGVMVGDAASELQRADARCVICQFVVQQAIGMLTGRPLTAGGATSGGKRAAELMAAPAAPAAPLAPDASMPMFESELPPAMFLEFEQAVDAMEAESEAEGEQDLFAFMELDASLSVMAESGLSAVLAAELESTVALNAAVSTFLSAADAAMQHTAVDTVRLHYPRSRAARQPHSGGDGGLRNMPAVSYPRQLNDWGFETTRRNRRSDTLLHRPRLARYSREDINAAKARWDEVHAKYEKLYSGVYSAFERLCSKTMPLAYVGYCHSMMKDYRYIAQGLAFGDRAQSICMNGNWCNQDSYVRHAVHTYFVREAGDH